METLYYCTAPNGNSCHKNDTRCHRGDTCQASGELPSEIPQRVQTMASMLPNLVTQAMVFDEKWSPSTLASSSVDTDDHLFASCNGLLCFYRTYTLKIANPVTGDCLRISKPDGILLHDCYYLYSFGFHPESGEYKLLHFLREPWYYRSGQPYQYTLGEDKWRDVRAPVRCCLVNLGVVNVGGAMYWVTEDEGRRSSVQWQWHGSHVV